MTIRGNTAAIVRVFHVSFRPNLDETEKDDIRFGVFGDLRMGDRYAVGLIARKRTTPEEIRRVGRLAKPLVQSPFAALKALHAEIWGNPKREEAFEEAVSETHSSLTFSSQTEVRLSSESVSGDDVEAVRNWCKAQLREQLRRALESWRGAVPAPERDGTDEMQMAA